MLTNEKVLSVFASFLAEDDTYDVLLTKRGYAVVYWEDEHYGNAECCPTPESLRDRLLRAYREYNEFSMLVRSGNTERTITADEDKELNKLCEAMAIKCK